MASLFYVRMRRICIHSAAIKWSILWVSCQVWWFTVLFSSSLSLWSSASLFIHKWKWGIKVTNYYCCIFYFSLQLFVFALCIMIVFLMLHFYLTELETNLFFLAPSLPSACRENWCLKILSLSRLLGTCSWISFTLSTASLA